mgnify:FL=1
MNRVKAKVAGDIPAHRLLWLTKSEDDETLGIKLPSEGGRPVDFVSTKPLEDGQEVTVTITGSQIWRVEAGEKVAPGDNVYADEDGRIISHNSNYLHSVGYVLDAGEEGDIVRMVRNYKFVDYKQA